MVVVAAAIVVDGRQLFRNIERVAMVAMVATVVVDDDGRRWTAMDDD